MPNRNVHHPAGATTGALAAVSIAKRLWAGPYLIESLGGAIGGLIGGALPDLIDTPTDPRHRGVAHAVAPVAGLCGAVLEQVRMKPREIRELLHRLEWHRSMGIEPPVELTRRVALERLLYSAVIGFTAGTGSHLALDSVTPDGLRLFCRSL